MILGVLVDLTLYIVYNAFCPGFSLKNLDTKNDNMALEMREGYEDY